MQNADGSIPASPFRNHSLVLVDYNAYWIESLYDYVLYTGDLALLRQVWPNLVKLVDDLYPAHVGSGCSSTGSATRTTPTSRAAGRGSPTTTRSTSARSGWPRRSPAGTATRGAPTAGGPRAHDTAARSRALLGSRPRAPSATRPATPTCTRSTATRSRSWPGSRRRRRPSRCSRYIDRTMRRSYGNSVADTNGWRGANWGDGDFRRVYPFVSYFELLARYAAARTPPRSS